MTAGKDGIEGRDGAALVGIRLTDDFELLSGFFVVGFFSGQLLGSVGNSKEHRVKNGGISGFFAGHCSGSKPLKESPPPALSRSRSPLPCLALLRSG